MTKSEYIKEALGEALCEHSDHYNLFTADQLQDIADDLLGAFECWSQYSGEECIPNPQIAEIEKLQKKLCIEESKVSCPNCGGHGRITSYGVSHTADSECPKCRGEGKVIR